MNAKSMMFAAAVLVLGGCAGSPATVFQSGTAMAPPLDASVLVLPADIVVSQVSVGGNVQPRADWTEAATESLNDALDEFFFNRGVMPVRYASDAIEDEDLDIIRQANINLDAIQLAQQGDAMPGMREYALTPELTRSLEEYGADYAVFFMLRARQASAGRTAARAIGGILTNTISIEAIPDAYRVALFDLRDGQVVWANVDPAAYRGLGNPGEADTGRWLRSFETLFRGFPL